MLRLRKIFLGYCFSVYHRLLQHDWHIHKYLSFDPFCFSFLFACAFVCVHTPPWHTMNCIKLVKSVCLSVISRGYQWPMSFELWPHMDKSKLTRIKVRSCMYKASITKTQIVCVHGPLVYHRSKAIFIVHIKNKWNSRRRRRRRNANKPCHTQKRQK